MTSPSAALARLARRIDAGQVPPLQMQHSLLASTRVAPLLGQATFEVGPDGLDLATTKSIALLSTAPPVLDVRTASIALPASPLSTKPVHATTQELDKQDPGRSRRPRRLRLAKLFKASIPCALYFLPLSACSSHGLRIAICICCETASQLQEILFSPPLYSLTQKGRSFDTWLQKELFRGCPSCFIILLTLSYVAFRLNQTLEFSGTRLQRFVPTRDSTHHSEKFSVSL